MFLLRYWARSGDRDAVEMAFRTLEIALPKAINF
jgi:hypothetical protein